ncbi:cation diffusion facilitator family transporter [Phreatobacter sp. AB_2022a]|uniref:cation diffusion facilitator family transporter n=1 Tax=Phreatobacter sp. AB_2022a TaxID=3003134 RepID=UPI00056F6D28|nr:cation diffusion facilitator family transporter [Phreatobacter sp. AB_2022a]MCZ0732663.1 cation diffusion facilitator family transporter [Phreatobacter sp. AB_2022a]CEJ11569.1 Cobalt-zinc-cadmium resistance protein CzcD [bacterium YEK0313]
MGAGHDHGARTQNQTRLTIALALTTTFLVAEVVGGILTNSLALLSDAAHMFTDAVGLAIALAAVRIARRPPDMRRTYGFYRFEILAAAFNAVLLFGVAIYILYEAWQRFAAPPEVQSVPMLVIAVLGLIVNIIAMRLLSAGKDASLNVKGAYLEVWSDFLGSVGVILGGLVIWLTNWTWVDTVIAVAIGLWVLPRTWILLRESIDVLLQAAPAGIDVAAVERDLKAIDGVADVHDLHVWSLTSDRNVVTAHIVTRAGPDGMIALRKQVETLLEQRYDLHLSTIQIEDETGHGA